MIEIEDLLLLFLNEWKGEKNGKCFHLTHHLRCYSNGATIPKAEYDCLSLLIFCLCLFDSLILEIQNLSITTVRRWNAFNIWIEIKEMNDSFDESYKWFSIDQQCHLNDMTAQTEKILFHFIHTHTHTHTWTLGVHIYRFNIIFTDGWRRTE